jgi:hypothetical protein
MSTNPDQNQTSTDAPAQGSPILEQQQNSRFSLSFILNQNPIGEQLQDYGSGSSSEDDGGSYNSHLAWNTDRLSSARILEPSISNPLPLATVDEPALLLPSSPPTQSHPHRTTSAGTKRKMITESDEESIYNGDSESDSDYTRPTTKYVRAGSGTSRSAVASRNQRQQLFDGSFKINKKKYKSWQAKILALDANAEFDDKNVRYARHSTCGKVVLMKDPYDVTRFKDHFNQCQLKRNQDERSPSLFQMGWLTKNTEEASSSPPTPMTVPCPGLTAVDHSKVVQYLKRTGALGGGGRSLPDIAKEKFNRLFSTLTNHEKRQVLDVQQHEWRWRNDHASSRVYSTACEKEVGTRFPRPPKPCAACADILRIRGFKNVLSKKIPAPENYKFVNERFRNSQLGVIYARTLGVQELVENVSAY